MTQLKGQKLEGHPVIHEHPSPIQVHLDQKSSTQPTSRPTSRYEILEVVLAVALILITGYLGYSYFSTEPFSLQHFGHDRDV